MTTTHVSAHGPRLGTSVGWNQSAGTTQAFEASTKYLAAGTPVVSVAGEVDIATARALEQTLLDVTEDETGAVIVDLTDCSFLDSRGVGALIATRARLDRSGRPLALVLSNPGVLRVLEITHLDELFAIYPSLGAAVDGNGRG